jgi:hypothetical protein
LFVSNSVCWLYGSGLCSCVKVSGRSGFNEKISFFLPQIEPSFPVMGPARALTSHINDANKRHKRSAQ